MWEIYIGDVIDAVQVTGQITPIANTNYGLKESGSMFTIHWKGNEIGHIQVVAGGKEVGIGRLDVDEAHRGSGIVRVLMLAVYVFGILKGCTSIGFNDPFASKVKSQAELGAFWRSVGMAGEGQTLKLTQAMTRLFANQGQFALKKGLAYTPKTVFLNPNPVIAPTLPIFSTGKTTGRKGSFSS